jgi:hypothetical protein
VAERPPAHDVDRGTLASAGEPGGAGARLTGEMTHPSTDHATHDELLIASLLDRSTGDPDRDRAEALVAACGDCAALHRDLVALSAASRVLPTPLRPREFTLSADDAERLRPRGLRRLIAAFGSSRDVFSRPLAIGLTTLGLAGLLVATIPGVLSGQGGASVALSSVERSDGGAGANPESIGTSSQAQAAPSAGPSAAAAQAAPAPVAPLPEALPSEPTYDKFGAGPVASGGAAAVAPGSSPAEDQAAAAPTPAELPAERDGVIVLAGLLLVVGLGLFALRWTARRLGDG